MVRNYVRKTQRQSWSTESMHQAVLSVINGNMGYKKAAEQFLIPQTTLERYVQKKNTENDNFKIDKTSGKFVCVFSTEQEVELENYLKCMEGRLFGLTMNDFRGLAYQLAVRNQCVHNFNPDTRMAGKDWMKGFLKRHPTLTLRKPEATSGARAMGFNRVAVSQFFNLLLDTIDKYKLSGDRIYNCDETGLTVNPKGHTKVLALKGKRQVGVLTSAERGQTITAEICFSASGAYMPPMLIFPRKKKQQSFEIGLPPGSMVEVSDSGWITTEVFIKWFKSFGKFSKASKENPVLLILDGHATHTKNIDVILYARENGIILLCFPPHTSHKLQPLDVSFMKPLSNYYENEVRTWLRCNPSKVVTIMQISTLFGNAFVNAATMKTAISGFRATGIWPPNENIFSDADFLPAATTDIQLNQEAPTENPITNEQSQITNLQQNVSEEPIDEFEAPTSSKFEQRKNVAVATTERVKSPPLFTASDILNPQPQCSSWGDIPLAKNNANSSFPCISPEVALPIPKISTAKRVSRKRGKTAILTSTPYKDELEESLAARKVSVEKKEKVKKNALFTSQKASIKKKVGKKIKRMKKNNQESDSSSEDSDEDAECLYCREFWSKSVDGWIACSVCRKWAHNACAGLESDDDDTALICEFCL